MDTNIATVASFVLQKVDLEIQRSLLEAVFRHIGLQEIDGIPIQEWISAKRSALLEKTLLDMGDLNPQAHDAVRAALSEAIQKTKPRA